MNIEVVGQVMAIREYTKKDKTKAVVAEVYFPGERGELHQVALGENGTGPEKIQAFIGRRIRMSVHQGTFEGRSFFKLLAVLGEAK